ncbi:MAG: SAM-dependent methyltransferase [Ruminococcaceae bacterium]|nr:SAM-dependent methyltransferase [Oscillospiraceae bacterium]
MQNSESNPPLCRMAELISRAACKGILKKAVLSKPKDSGTVRTALTLRLVGGRTVLQAETLRADHKALHENIEREDVERILSLSSAFLQINLLTSVGECELRRSKNGKETLLGGEKLLRAMETAEAPTVQVSGNNREKSYILKGDEPFLRLLDVSDANGRVKDKKQSKFRQINRFLELIRDCLGHLPKDGTLRVCDLCCGKSYLSFAAYHYFANVLGRRVRMTGVDLKPDVVEYCNSVAKKLSFDGLEFLCGDVGKYDTEDHVHLVISLHACDIATDLVLGKAAQWKSDVILSTPCCHHEMNHTLSCEALSFIAEHSMLRQKLCDAATDALRLKRLEASGYAVCTLELIDPEETPKNIMLRALRRPDFDPRSKEAQRLMEEYRAAKAFLVGDADVAF